MQTAEGNTHILAPEGPRDGLAERSLANSGRTVETENRGLHIALELKHGKVLYYTFLDLLKPEMILVEDLLGVLEIQIVLRHLTPWQIQHELDEIVLYAVVRARRIVLFELLHLLGEYRRDLLGPLLLGGTGAEFLEFFTLIHTELLLDGAELVIEEVFPLLLVNVAADLLVDLLLYLQELKLRIKRCQKFHRPDADVRILQEVDLVTEIVDLNRSRYEIDEEVEAVNR